MSAEILLLGDPRLREISLAVNNWESAEFKGQCNLLAETLSNFRQQHNFGRAISAPQIGFNIRVIAFNLQHRGFFMVNPVITRISPETFTMWDDCMSFPDLLVRVRRHTSICVKFLDTDGNPQTLEHLPQSESELVQHEIDHLDGVLALDRAIDRESVIYRTMFNRLPEHFRSMVDYVIS